MLNHLWLGMVTISVAVALVTGTLEPTGKAVLSRAQAAVMDVMLPMAGMITLWMGVMRLVETSGLIRLIARFLSPVMKLLFPEVPRGHPVLGAIAMNLGANMLGAGNAATPMGLRAMEQLNRLNATPGTASNSMVMLLALNTSGITLIPASTIAFLQARGAAQPTDIIGPAILASTLATLCAALICFGLQKFYPLTVPSSLNPERESPLPPPLPGGTAGKERTSGTADLGNAGGLSVSGAGTREAATVSSQPLTAGSAVTASTGHSPSEGASAPAVAVEPGNQSVTSATPPESPDGGGPAAGQEGKGQPLNAWRQAVVWLAAAFFLTVMMWYVVAPQSLLELQAAAYARIRQASPAQVNWFTQVPDQPHLRLMNFISVAAMPAALGFFVLYAALARVKVYEELVEGAKDGIAVTLRVIPYVVAMLVAVGMFTESGALGIMERALKPVLGLVRFPVEVLPISIVRSLSGGAATGLLDGLVSTHGADSLFTKIGATINGSSETTFYVAAVYFGAVGVRRMRHAIPTGLLADACAVIFSILFCRLLLG